MAAGDLINRKKQYEFRNLLIGSNTVYVVEQVDGLHSMPEIERTDTEYQFKHGSAPGFVRMAEREIEIEMKIDSSVDDIGSALAAVRSAFQLPRRRFSRTLEPFVWMDDDNIKKRVMARCLRRNIPSDYELALGLGQVDLLLVAPDPIILSNTLRSAQVNLGVGSTSGSVDIENLGDFVDGYDPTIQIQGPFVNPRITNENDDFRQIKIDVEGGAADVLEINVKNNTVTLNGVDVFEKVRTDNLWWSVLPGTNRIVYDRDGSEVSAASRLTIFWRDTWQ